MNIEPPENDASNNRAREGFATTGLETVVEPRDAHKNHEANLWLNNLSTNSADRAALTFQIPQTGAGPRFADFIEVERQAGLVFAHRCLEVPHSNVFVLTSLDLKLKVTSKTLRDTCSTGTVFVRATETRRSRDVVRSASVAMNIVSGAGVCGTGNLSSSFVAPAIYERFRSRQSSSSSASGSGTAPPHLIRATEEVDVDPSDPILADHASDHVTAMALICAVEKSIGKVSQRRIQFMSITFSQYIDLLPRPRYSYFLTHTGDFEGSLRQKGQLKVSFYGNLDSDSK